MSNSRSEKASIRWILIVAIASLLPASHASADFCEGYAAEAVADAAKAKAMSCAAGDPNPGEFSGPRWDASYGDHLNWCRAHQGEIGSSGDTNVPGDETRARLTQLVHCAICNDYAKQAVAQVQAAVKLKCNFTGAEWDGTIAGQMRSCYAQGVGWVAFNPQQTNDRNAKLRVCKLAHPSLRNLDLGLRSGDGTVAKGGARQPTSSEPSSSKSSSSRTVAPGLLEGDSGFATQGPAPGGPRSGPNR